MDIIEFLNRLEQFIEELERTVNKIENNASSGMQNMPKVIKGIEELLPDWFFFIENTGIGDKQEILNILSDVMYGMQAEDSIFLSDALFYGLRELMLVYKNVIEEALHGE